MRILRQFGRRNDGICDNRGRDSVSKSVAAGVNLTHARILNDEHARGRMTPQDVLRDTGKRGHGNDGHIPRDREALHDRHANANTGKRARTGTERHGIEGLPINTGFAKNIVNHRQDEFGVPSHRLLVATDLALRIKQSDRARGG